MGAQTPLDARERSAVSGCGVATGLGLVVLGSLLLVARFLDVPVWEWAFRIPWDWAWTLFVIAPGAVMLAFGLFGPRDSAGLVIPGCIVTVVGLTLLAQAWFDVWATWAYAWTLVVASVGLGLFLFGVRTAKSQVRRVGSVMLASGLIAFAGFAFFFEVIVGLGGFFGPEVRRAVLPALVILAGVFIVVSSIGPKKASSATETQPSQETSIVSGAPSEDVTPGAPGDPPPSA